MKKLLIAMVAQESTTGDVFSYQFDFVGRVPSVKPFSLDLNVMEETYRLDTGRLLLQGCVLVYLYFSLIMKRTTCLLKRLVFLFYTYCQRQLSIGVHVRS
jgi:hypothetical protein